MTIHAKNFVWSNVTLATAVDDPRYPEVWNDEVPLAILGDVQGRDPYNTAIESGVYPRPSNHRLTPAHPDLDDTQEVILGHILGRRR